MIPEIPPARDAFAHERGTADLLPRYEDITQDGRMVLTSMMPGTGAAVWRALLEPHPAFEALRAQGILPILRRLVLVGDPGPCSAAVPVRYEGRCRLAREDGGDRLFLNMWVEASAPPATTYGPAPPADAPRARMGRIFAEHVMTRPFAPKEERRVTRLDAPGLPAVPEDTYAFESGEALLALAAGAPSTSAGAVTFGLMHTDANQHVNSLVYPRLFEEAALARLASLGMRELAGSVVARGAELRWRKPFFAGERATMRMAVVTDGAAVARVPGTRVLVVGSFGRAESDATADEAGEPREPGEPPHCTLALWLG